MVAKRGREEVSGYVRGPTRAQRRKLEAAGISAEEPGIPENQQIIISRVGDSVLVKGATYPLRAELRAARGNWFGKGANYWSFAANPSPTALLELCQLDALPEDGKECVVSRTVLVDSSTVPFTCTNGKSISAAYCRRSRTKCFKCKKLIRAKEIIIGRNTYKTISRCYGDGPGAQWKKQVPWTHWSHLQCIRLPKTMSSQIIASSEALCGGVGGLDKLSAIDQHAVVAALFPSRIIGPTLTALYNITPANGEVGSSMLPTNLIGLVMHYLFADTPALDSQVAQCFADLVDKEEEERTDANVTVDAKAKKQGKPKVNLDGMTVAQLRRFLRKHSADHKGRKAQLLERAKALA